MGEGILFLVSSNRKFKAIEKVLTIVETRLNNVVRIIAAI